jgi:hypothetical protein
MGLNINQAIQDVVQQSSLAVHSLSEQLGRPRKVLSSEEQIKKFRTLSSTQRLQLKLRVGEEEYARYEDAMRQLSARGL